MSKISLAPDASGSGIFTIASPNSNTNRTLTLPDDTGTIVTNSGNQAGSFTTLNTSGAVVFNDAGADVDFRVESDTVENALFVDGATGNIGLGTTTAVTKATVYGSGDQKLSLVSPTGSSTQVGINLSPSMTDAEAAANPAQAAIYATDSSYSANIIFANKATGAVGNALTERMRIDSSGNLGLGVTPSAWSAGKAIQVNDVAVSLWGVSGNTVLGNNSYYNSTDKYATTSGASQYTQFNGEHIWYTAPSGTADDTITFTQAMTLDASGNVGIGTSSPSGRDPSNLVLQISSANEPEIKLTAAGGTNTFLTFSPGANTNSWITNTQATNSAMIFGVGGYTTERMRITSDGNLLVGKTVVNNSSAGIRIDGPNGFGSFVRDSNAGVLVNRLTNDGDLVEFYQASVLEGSISVSGSTVSYNGGHLSRWAQLTTPKDDTPLLKGTVMSNLDEMNLYIAPTTYWTEEDELPEGVTQCWRCQRSRA
jgi:hypothetical protein